LRGSSNQVEILDYQVKDIKPMTLKNLQKLTSLPKICSKAKLIKLSLIINISLS